MTGRQRMPVEGEVPNPIDPPAGCAFHPRCPFANERCRAEVPPLLARASPATPSRKGVCRWMPPHSDEGGFGRHLQN